MKQEFCMVSAWLYRLGHTLCRQSYESVGLNHRTLNLANKQTMGIASEGTSK